MSKKLYSWLTFNKEGNLRGFSSGFTKTQSNKLILEDIHKGNIVIVVENLLKVPSKFIEGYYYKFSKNNDLKEFLTYQNS